MCRVDEGDTRAFETGARETTAIHSWKFTHDVIDGYEFGRTTLVVVDRALARVEDKLPEEFQIAGLPRRYPLSYAAVLGIEMLSPACKACRHSVFGLLVCLLRNVAQECLVKCLQRLFGVCQHVPCRGLTLIYAEVIVAVNQRACQAREEDSYLKRQVFGFLALSSKWNKTIFVCVTVKEQKVIFLSQGDGGLVQQSVAESYILPLCLRGYLHHLERLQFDAVGLGQCHDVCNEYGGG